MRDGVRNKTNTNIKICPRGDGGWLSKSLIDKQKLEAAVSPICVINNSATLFISAISPNYTYAFGND